MKSTDTYSYWGAPSGYPKVTSKWSEPRSVGTSPHWGIDLAAPSSDPYCYAVTNGTLYKTGDGFNTLTQNAGNGVYIHYKHMSTLDSGTNDLYAAKEDKLGKVGGYGGYPVHLHIGAHNSKYTNVGEKSMPMSTFWRHVGHSNWQYGRGIDVASFPSVSGRTLSIYASFSGEDNDNCEPPKSVNFYYKFSPNASWVKANESDVSKSNYRYSYTLPPYASSMNVYWCVQIEREYMPKPWAYSPAKYYNPGSNLNDSRYTFDYYTNYIY